MHPDAGAHGLSVIVVGGGPSGLAAAIALRRAGASVTVCERAERPRRDGQGLTLWPNGLAALDAIGAGDAVRARGLFADGLAMRSQSGRVLSLVPPPVMESVGGNGLALHRAELVEALVSAAGAITYGTRCVGVRNEPGRAVAVFADGSEQGADLVVGADGLRSAVRLAAGLGGVLSPGGCTVWR
ncbi:MAG: FAD-dependent monooxygenase, partial [Chloroflexi bacterium]|nr:FAD-dependent monooxygenase [Acidobacteriota bacterium]MCA1587972.1 FAD-dependent monooxygenase [Chloroflexota bacterium]MCA1719549.1 FAD-dependent monooxygenase [Actinomycetota bacterium]